MTPPHSSSTDRAGLFVLSACLVAALLVAFLAVRQQVEQHGQSIFIGGLIRNSNNFKRAGIPLLGDIPVIGNAFSRWEDGGASSETVVVITPRIIRDAEAASDKPSARLQEAEPPLLRSAMKLEHTLEHLRPLD